MEFAAGRICLLLMASCIAVNAECDDSSALFQPKSICPAEPFGVEAVPAPSESECVLRCTLSSGCRQSVYLTDSRACYSLPHAAVAAACSPGMIARGKLSPATPPDLLSLSFSMQIVLLYNFRKSYKNLANSCEFPAEPVGIAEQNSIDGVRLQGSSSSHVKVSTPGFYKYFNYGQKFSLFFQGKFGMNFSSKCFGAFVDVTRNDMYSSTFHADIQGRISTKVFFPTGDVLFRHYTSNNALDVGSVQRVESVGINFDGLDFATHLNGATVARQTWGGSPRKSSGSLYTIHDTLLIGNCMRNGIEPFDGWLQCWALLTGNLDTSQFDELRNLCNSP
uniref:Apple domain-containing protein n=1 Tax=Macrostomum lignano TaxID=282301 RepID=A0A1I8GB94_9PLAT